MSPQSRLASCLGTALAAGALAVVLSRAASADDARGTIAAGTRVRLHVLSAISSNGSRTGEKFAFVLLSPIASGSTTIPVDGTTGSGLVFLAGHAGNGGHEGDLTLRLDTLRTADGRIVTFADQRFKINGRNRKVASGALGFVPYVGIASIFIRGSDIRVDPATPIETVLARAATVLPPGAAASPEPVPSREPVPSPSHAASTSAAASPSPAASPAP